MNEQDWQQSLRNIVALLDLAVKYHNAALANALIDAVGALVDHSPVLPSASSVSRQAILAIYGNLTFKVSETPDWVSFHDFVGNLAHALGGENN